MAGRYRSLLGVDLTPDIHENHVALDPFEGIRQDLTRGTIAFPIFGYTIRRLKDWNLEHFALQLFATLLKNRCC